MSNALFIFGVLLWAAGFIMWLNTFIREKSEGRVEHMLFWLAVLLLGNFIMTIATTIGEVTI